MILDRRFACKSIKISTDSNCCRICLIELCFVSSILLRSKCLRYETQAWITSIHVILVVPDILETISRHEVARMTSLKYCSYDADVKA